MQKVNKHEQNNVHCLTEYTPTPPLWIKILQLFGWIKKPKAKPNFCITILRYHFHHPTKILCVRIWQIFRFIQNFSDIWKCTNTFRLPNSVPFIFLNQSHQQTCQQQAPTAKKIGQVMGTWLHQAQVVNFDLYLCHFDFNIKSPIIIKKAPKSWAYTYKVS